jgi:cell division septation protein DedD
MNDILQGLQMQNKIPDFIKKDTGGILQAPQKQEKSALKIQKVIRGNSSRKETENVKQSIEIAPSTITVGTKSSQPIAATTEPVKTTPITTTPETTTPVKTTTPETTPLVTTPITSTTATSTTTEPTTKTTEPVVAATTPVNSEPSSIVCSRTLPGNVSDNFTVEILVNKGNVTGFAKLLETLPAGYTASAGDVQGASFSFDGQTQKVKFVWVSMPSQTEFKISYKVTVPVGANGTQNIDGVFSYIENDETKKFILPRSSITIGSSSSPIATTTTQVITTTTPVINTTTPVTTTTVATTTTPVKTTEPTTTTASTTKSLSPTSSIPAPQGNVNYRVQIAALHNAVDANNLAVRYNINGKVNTEMAEGFTKYTVGSHNEYKEARDSREEIRNKGVVGPFVTAYNIGKRITVQEAIMITSQKWYR